MLFQVLLTTILSVQAEPIRIAVIDSGAPYLKSESFKKCAPSYDFTRTGVLDTHGHGTNIAHIIKEKAGDADICFIFIKVFSNHNVPTNLQNVSDAVLYAIAKRANIINLSMAGVGRSEIEDEAIKLAISRNIIVVAAAGNTAKKLDPVTCDTFPACSHPSIIVVGNGPSETNRRRTSNYGPVVDKWVDGHKVGPKGLEMSGSSQSAAIFTGLLSKNAFDMMKRLGK